MIEVKDITPDSMDDVFSVCSPSTESEPWIEKGRSLKREWLMKRLKEHGPLTKIAYHDGAPVAQIMFYPEEMIPYKSNPRKNVVEIACIYNQTKRKGAGSALLESLIKDGTEGLKCLNGEKSSFLVSNPFDTSEELSLGDFYRHKGFEDGDGEMYLELAGKYEPPVKNRMKFSSDDYGKAILFYDVNCEFSVYFAHQIKSIIETVSESYPLEIYNTWEHPELFREKGLNNVVVNGVPITSFWRSDSFRDEVKTAISAKP